MITKAITPTIAEMMTDCLGSALPELRATLVQINTPTPTAKTTAIKNDDISYIKSERKTLSNSCKLLMVRFNCHIGYIVKFRIGVKRK